MDQMLYTEMAEYIRGERQGKEKKRERGLLFSHGPYLVLAAPPRVSFLFSFPCHFGDYLWGRAKEKKKRSCQYGKVDMGSYCLGGFTLCPLVDGFALFFLFYPFPFFDSSDVQWSCDTPVRYHLWRYLWRLCSLDGTGEGTKGRRMTHTGKRRIPY